MTWRIPKFLLFSSLSKATWPRRDEGSRNSWICLGFAMDGAQAHEETFQRMNIPVYFLGTAGHGISRSPGKGIESNPEIFGKKQEKSAPRAAPRSNIAHSMRWAAGSHGILAFRAVRNAVFLKFLARKRNSDQKLKQLEESRDDS